MPDSIREQAIQAIVTRLNNITAANSYNNDVGANVFRVVPTFDDSQLPAVAVWDIEETSQYHYHKNQAVLTLLVSMHAINGAVNASVKANQMLADIIKAVTDGDTTLAGLVSGIEYTGSQVAYPDDGQIAVNVEATFLVKYEFVKGDPYQ